MISDLFEAFKHLLWPTRCASCDILLDAPDKQICKECSQSIVDPPEITAPENIDHAFALFVYEGAIQSMISKWKYHEDFSAQNALMSLISLRMDALRALNPEGICLIPVPPHPRRLRERGFDPVWTFASRLHRAFEQAGIQTSFRDDVLVRTRHTVHQASLTHDERLHNLDGAFELKQGFACDHAVLIDDVMTTGATASICAKALRDAGITRIDFIALARTLDSGKG